MDEPGHVIPRYRSESLNRWFCSCVFWQTKAVRELKLLKTGAFCQKPIHDHPVLRDFSLPLVARNDIRMGRSPISIHK
jgi:hypothetical protein